MRRIGLISDTHGLLRPEAIEALRGSHHIVHAGDIGDPAILDRLASLAPVTAVRGNNDVGEWTRTLHDTAELEVDGVRIHVRHDRGVLDHARRATDVVVSGHSHKPSVTTVDGTLYVNPGSAGPRRFKLPVAVGELTISHGKATARIIELEVAPPARAPRRRR